MYLLGIHNGSHDASACLFRDYKLVSAVSLERLTRKKNAGVTAEQEIPLAAIDECLSIAGIARADVDVVCSTRNYFEFQTYALRGRWKIKQLWAKLTGRRRLMLMTYIMRKQNTKVAADVFDAAGFRQRHGFFKAKFYFANHHHAHGAAAYFFSEFKDALIYTADGFGDDVAYSARAGKAGEMNLVFGGDENLHRPMKVNSIGLLYNQFTEALGFIPNRHEGKLTGLSAFGKPKLGPELANHFSGDGRGEVSTDFPTYPDLENCARQMCKQLSREDAAATVQFVTEKVICEAVDKLVKTTGLKSVAAAGGIFANVKANRAVLETTAAEKIFVFPAMGDEGLPVGACLLYLHERDGAAKWQASRYKLEDVYLGRDYDEAFRPAAAKYPQVQRDDADQINKAVEALVRGEVVSIYTSRMEYGPRALGARTIMASPVQREVNDTINKRLDRSEFMPFAPVVLAEHAATVFDVNPGNAHAARFMTITCDVKPEWRERIPAVVHVDGSARPQVIVEKDNPLYFRVLTEFYKRTGLPVLVNTSFNVHEEPIVDTPDQALKSLADGRIDRILTEEALYQVVR
jgi:carbamoyltransferase